MARYGDYQAPNENFERAETGEKVVKLTKIEDKERPSFNDQNVMEETWQWWFETTTEKDSKGNPFRCPITTKKRYGNEKATLTLIIDGMFGRHLSEDEWLRLNIDKLIGQTFKSFWELQTGDNGQYNRIKSIYRPKTNPLKLSDFLDQRPDPTGAQSEDIDDNPSDNPSDDPFAD